MILHQLACDKCYRKAKWTSAPHFTASEIRRYAQREGWRYRKKADLCPECAVKVLGVIGAAARPL